MLASDVPAVGPPHPQPSFINREGSYVANQTGHQSIKGDYYGKVVKIEHYHESASPAIPIPTAFDRALVDDLSVTDKEVLKSLTFDQVHHRRNQIERAHPDTCHWVLELPQFRQWENYECGPLWIKGKPGAGKSTIMSFLYRDYKKKTSHEEPAPIILQFFFTARGSPLQRTFLGMLRSLLTQLFLQDDSIRHQTRQLYLREHRSFGQRNRRVNRAWEQEELGLLFLAAVETSAQTRSLMILIDALDEAGEEAAKDIAHYLHEINDRIRPTILQSSMKGKICISCRHYPVPSLNRSTEIKVEAHNNSDISKFVSDRINLEGLVSETYSAAEKEQWQRLAEEVVLRANGVFQWVRLVVPKVESWLGDARLYGQVGELLEQVPKPLEETYEYIFQSVVASANQSDSISFFQWICLAGRSLSVGELRYALAAQHISLDPLLKCHEHPSFSPGDEHMKRWIMTLSGGLAEVVKQAGDELTQVQVVHQSVLEFFRTKGWHILATLSREQSAMSQSNDDHVDEFIMRSHSMLYWSCMRYLATDEGAICWKAPWEKMNTSLTGGGNELVESSPLAHYATVNLLLHAEKAGHYRSEDPDKEIDLWQQILPHWIEIYATIDYNAVRRPKPGSTILHVAAASNLGDMVEMLIHSSKFEVDALDQSFNTPLNLAVQWNHEDIAKFLVQAGAQITGVSLIQAAKAGESHIALLRWLVSEVLNTTRTSDSLKDTLEWAVNSGDETVIDALIDASRQANIPLDLSESLMRAVYLADGENTVRLLLAAGANVNAQGEHHGSALQTAVVKGHEAIAEILLDYGADIDTALVTASEHGRPGIVRKLLESRIDDASQKERYGLALQKAARYGHEEIVEILLGDITVNNTRGKLYGQALQAAVLFGHIKAAELLLEAKAEIDDAVLQAAASNGSQEIVKMLLAAGASVETTKESNESALQAAVNKGHTDIVRQLLAAGSRAGGRDGALALQIAASKGYIEIVQILLDAGANVNYTGGLYGSALQAAVSQNRDKVVQLLLNNGVDYSISARPDTLQKRVIINQRQSDGRQRLSGVDLNDKVLEESAGSSLQLAVISGRVKIVQMLIHADVLPGKLVGQHTTALQLACKYNHEEVVQFLLRRRSDVHAVDNSDRFALQAAVVSGSERIVQRLISAGVDARTQNGPYGSNLEAAIRFGHVGIVRMFLRPRTEINIFKNQYNSALQLASEYGHVAIVQLLITAGADVNAPAGLRGSALQLAVIYDHLKIVEVLLKADADINDYGGLRGSALQAAADKGHEAIVKLLLEAGADIDIRYGSFGSALECATRRKHEGIVKMLMDVGAKV